MWNIELCQSLYQEKLEVNGFHLKLRNQVTEAYANLEIQNSTLQKITVLVNIN